MNIRTVQVIAFSDLTKDMSPEGREELLCEVKPIFIAGDYSMLLITRDTFVEAFQHLTIKPAAAIDPHFAFTDDSLSIEHEPYLTENDYAVLQTALKLIEVNVLVDLEG